MVSELRDPLGRILKVSMKGSKLGSIVYKNSGTLCRLGSKPKRNKYVKLHKPELSSRTKLDIALVTESAATSKSFLRLREARLSSGELSAEQLESALENTGTQSPFRGQGS